MTEIRFYHLQKKSAESVVFDLIERALQKFNRIQVRVRDEKDANRLNDFLWTNKAESFLPHGTSSEQFADKQPVLITALNDNQNGAEVVFLMPGCDTANIESFALCCDILDGRDEEQIASGRARYKDWKARGHNLSYWQQSDSGKWEQK